MRKPIFCLMLAAGLMMSFVSAADAQPVRKSVSAAEVTGTFKLSFVGKKFEGLTNRLDILALGGGKLKIAFDLLYPYTIEHGILTANLGKLSGEASIKGDTAIFETDEFGPCKVTIRFVQPGQVKVTQEGTDANCGFGRNVTTQGTYRKVSGRKPKFDVD